MSASVTLLKCDVPIYLQNSEFYRSLSDEAYESFTILSHHFKANTHIETQTDLDSLLSTLRFWGVEICPSDVLEWVWLNPVSSYDTILMEYWQISSLRKMYLQQPRRTAIVTYLLNIYNVILMYQWINCV